MYKRQRWGQPRPMRHFYPHPLTGNDWNLFMALVMLHKLLPMFVNRKTIVLGTGMSFLLAQTLVHLFHVLLLLFCAGNAYFISFCSVFSSSSTTSSFPARIPSATQVRIWFASSSRSVSYTHLQNAHIKRKSTCSPDWPDFPG